LLPYMDLLGWLMSDHILGPTLLRDAYFNFARIWTAKNDFTLQRRLICHH
jgi:hypothetical protein